MKKIVKNMSINKKFFQFEETNGNKNIIPWENIIKVIIETNDLGPM
jgi:sporulation protein YlmC with PRC-barrel domain